MLRRISLNNAKTLFRKLLQASAAGCYQVSFEQLREILAVPDSYSNYEVMRNKIKPAVLQLVPFFGNLSYEVVKSGKANKIVGITFTFDKFSPEELLTLREWHKYSTNISANSHLSLTEQLKAEKILEKNFGDCLK